MDKVSVIVPFYNNEKYIKTCVDSIRSQTYQNLEILLIDDGSTDSSGELLKDCAKTDSRIRLIHQKNQGVAAARNRGWTRQPGNILLLLMGMITSRRIILKSFTAVPSKKIWKWSSVVLLL